MEIKNEAGREDQETMERQGGQSPPDPNPMPEEQEQPALSMPSLEMIEAEFHRESYKSSYRRVIRSTAFSLIVVAAAAALIAILVLPILQISGDSMSDTLHNGDIVLALNNKHYETGDVIAFYYNNNVLVKRVIATAGDWVDIDDDGNVSVNGELLDEPYVSDKALGECNIELPYQVPEGRFFVMGDHRAVSIDSRNTSVGCISDEMAIGKLMFRVWPMSGFGFIQ